MSRFTSGLGVGDSGGSGDDVQALGLLVGDPHAGSHLKRFERCHGVVDLGLCVSSGETPCVTDAGECQETLGHITDCQGDTAGCGLQGDGDGSCGSGDLEGQAVSLAASALPGSASPLDLDHVQFRVVDSLLDRRSDLFSLGPADADESVAVSDDACHGEPDPPSGVGHPLDHVEVDDLVFQVREEDVHDLGLAEGQLRGQGVAHGGDLSVEDHLSEPCLGNPVSHFTQPPSSL